MKIAIVLPQNNLYSSVNTKPVVLAMKPYAIFSKYVNNITVISAFTKAPIEAINYKIMLTGENITTKAKYYKEVLKYINELNPSIVEVHQDLKLATFISKFAKKTNSNISVSLVKHADYLVNRFKENFKLMRLYYYYKFFQHIDVLMTNSKYVEKKILQMYGNFNKKTYVCYNNYGYINDISCSFNKKKQIVFAGKPIKNKGIIEFMNSLLPILENNKNYCAVVLGGMFSKHNWINRAFNKLIKKQKFQKLINNKQLVVHNKISQQEVFNIMCESNIAVVATKKPEPFGLVAMEAHLANCLVISSGTGGLKEVSGDFALYLKSVSANEISNNITIAISSDFNIASLGKNYVTNKFKPQLLADALDNFRASLNVKN